MSLVNQITTIGLLFLAAINAITFLLYGIDKYRARHARWRISEATLFWLSLCGGSLGAWLGMKVWHHKTQHNKFKYGIPLILLLQMAIAAYCFYRCS